MVRFIEIAEAEAILFRTDQIQLEIVLKDFRYSGFVTLWRFLCQDKRKKYYYVVII